jgi:hypothetical protein
MANSQIDALSILIEAATQVEEAPQSSPGGIKIRFKKGALSPKSAEKAVGEGTITTPVLIRLGPESEKKRKAVEDSGFKIDEHAVSHTSNLLKTGDLCETRNNIANSRPR